MDAKRRAAVDLEDVHQYLGAVKSVQGFIQPAKGAR